jgi:hypothetical protein
MEVSGQLHALAALPSGKETSVSVNRRLSWPQSQSGRCGKQQDLVPAENGITTIELVNK